MSLAILFHFLCTQHVSDINISIIRSLRLCCWIITSVILFLVRCVLAIWCGCVAGFTCNTDTSQTQPHQIANTQRTKNKTTNVIIQQHSCKLLMMDILMSETCWVHKKWNKIASDIKLVFYSSTITMMHGPINIRFIFKFTSSEEPHLQCSQELHTYPTCHQGHFPADTVPTDTTTSCYHFWQLCSTLLSQCLVEFCNINTTCDALNLTMIFHT